MEIRGLIDFIAKTSASIEAFVNDKARLIKNDVSDLIKAVVKRHSRLQLPIMKGEFIRKVSGRENLQDPENMLNFAEAKGITNFDELQSFMDEHGATYEKLDADYDKKSARIKELHSKRQAYDRYADYLEVYKKSKSLKGFAKLKFDRENKAMLDAYPSELERLQKVIPKGEKVTLGKWQKEIEQLLDEQEPIGARIGDEVYDLAYAEVLKFNKTNEERERANDRSAKEHQISRGRKHSYLER